MRKLLCFLGVALIVALAAPAMAQERSGSLFVNVMDEQGGRLEGVQAVLGGADFNRTANTNAEGQVRFTGIVPGQYELTLSFRGFNTTILQGVQIDAGASATFDVTLQRSELVEEVVVTARTPLLDKRKMGTSTIFTKSEIEQVPTARDPWSIVSTIPGITTDRVNVAGSEAGQQANFVGKGDDGNQTVWNMDGVEFTDVAAIGASQTYLDFNAFEQIGVATSGANFEAQTPGVQMEFVTKQGSNRHSGTARFLYSESQFQTDNAENLTQPEWIGSAAIAGNQINEIFEKNFDIGGPLLRDKLWYWFGFTQNDIDLQLITGQADKTKLRNISAKVHGQAGFKTSYKAFYTEGNKVKEGRGGGIDRPPETTWLQSGPTPIWGGSVSHFFTPDLELSLQASSIGGGFGFTPGGDFSQQIFLDETGVYHNTFSVYETVRPVDQFTARGNYFLSTGDWDHELKFGFRYKTAAVNSFSKYSEADMIANKSYDPFHYVYLYRELNTAVDLDYYNAWIGDTVLKGPWAINAGLHWSSQTGEQMPSSSAPNGTFPDLIEGLDFAGFDPGFKWTDLSPRLGVTYTFDWERRLMLRASYSSYVDQLGSGIVSYNLPLTYVGVAYEWNDLNLDDFVDQNELVDQNDDGIVDCDDNIGSYNIDPCNTAAATSPFQIDPDLQAPSVDEFIVGAEYEIYKDFTIGANYAFRSRDGVIWTPLFNNTLFEADGTLASLGSDIFDCDNLDYVVSGTAPDGREYSEPYCVLTDLDDVHPAVARWQTNMPGYKQQYSGLELTATKRLSNKWMMRGFVSFSDWSNEFQGTPVTPGIYGLGASNQSGDPTNYRGGTTDDGGPIAVQSLASGNKRDVFVGSSRWQVNVNGLYQLPWNWSVSGNLYGRQGYGIPYYATAIDENFVVSATKNLQVEGVDSVRYDDLWLLDLRAAKLFPLEGNANVEIALEVFNALNENSVLQINGNLGNEDTYNRIGEIVSPRIFRFMATINF